MDYKFKFTLQGGVDAYAPLQKCLRFANLESNTGYSPYGTFDGWTINGLDFITNYVNEIYVNSIGIFAIQLVQSPQSNWIFPQPIAYQQGVTICYYYNSNETPVDPILPPILDANGDPVPQPNWTSVCGTTCYEYTFTKEGGFAIFQFISDFTTPMWVMDYDGFYTIYDIQDPAVQNSILVYYQSIYPNVIVTFTKSGNDWVVKLIDFPAGINIFWNAGDPSYGIFVETPC